MASKAVVRRHYLLSICVSAALMIGAVEGMRCYQPGSSRSSKKYIECPTINDDEDEQYCCQKTSGSGPQYCCNAEEHKTQGALFSSTIFSSDTLSIFAMLGLLLIIAAVSYCIRIFVWVKWREKRQRATQANSTVPVPSTDAAGRPLYPMQQYHPVAEEGSFTQQQFVPGENIHHATAPQNYADVGGRYAMNQLASAPPDPQRSGQPFTYGPTYKTEPGEYNK